MDPELEADELLVLARLDLKKGEMEGALQKLKRAQGKSDVGSEALIELARLYAQLGLRRRAIPFFDTYLKAVPGDIDARFQLGMAIFEEGDRQTAGTIWEHVLNIRPQYPPALFYKALAAFQQGQIESAKVQVSEALKVLQTDNLYFSRSRELLREIESAESAQAGTMTRNQELLTQH